MLVALVSALSQPRILALSVMVVLVCAFCAAPTFAIMSAGAMLPLCCPLHVLLPVCMLFQSCCKYHFALRFARI